MANQNVETVTSLADRAKVMLAIALVVAGLAGFYMLDQLPMIARVGSVLGGLVAGALVGMTSTLGQRFFAFAKDSWAETRRVVWPDRKETTQMTMIVFAFVVAMALFLWVVDKLLEWGLYDLALGWKG
ncbi:MAG: preprotein translocase subunit SecE [Burkholderiaceae bacterium]|nr:preprotein translocase subunit SecE [Burkholderiaceae bacterium]